MLTKIQLADELQISLVTVDRMIKRGMPYYKTSSDKGMVRFDLDEVKNWLKKNSK